MPRIQAHVIETESRQIFERKITCYSNERIGIYQGDLLFRLISERDYGIDGEIELFSKGETTGRIARIQLKGTSKKIETLKNTDAVSCSGITKSNLGYCRQNNVPVILVYCSVTEEIFYYVDLQSVFQCKIDEIADNYTGTIRIPSQNNSNDLSKLINIINSYYDDYTEFRLFKRKESRFKLDFHIFGEEIQTYEFKRCDGTPSDGEHKEVGINGCVLAVGEWRKGKLIYGTEYNWLIKVTKGKINSDIDRKKAIHEEETIFDYEKQGQFGANYLGMELLEKMGEAHIYGDNYYVVDLEIKESTEGIINIRTLEEYLYT